LVADGDNPVVEESTIRSDCGAASNRLDPARTVIAIAPAAIHSGGSASAGSSCAAPTAMIPVAITIAK
jgi:hypothetical protein